MKDRFKFRGKRLDNNQLYYGSYLYLHNATEYDYAGNRKETKKDVHFIIDENDINYAVDPETVGQCTGLKDKNGKLIFEGDIVKFKKIYKCACFTQEEEVLFKVIWEGYGFYLSQIKVIKGSVSYITGRRLTVILEKDTYTEHQTDISLEVIGNIYENKELLNEI